MTAALSITPSDLRRPTDYKPRYERELNRRLHLQGRVEALELERDALKYRLQVAEAELKRRGMVPVGQARLAGVGA
jgi:hypothetical protein